MYPSMEKEYISTTWHLFVLPCIRKMCSVFEERTHEQKMQIQPKNKRTLRSEDVLNEKNEHETKIERKNTV